MACGDPPDPFFAVTKQKRKNSSLGTRLDVDDSGAMHIHL